MATHKPVVLTSGGFAELPAGDTLGASDAGAPGPSDFARLGEVLGRPHGFLNRLINGDFRVNQRAYASGAALPAGSYAHDRWKAGSGGCTYTYLQGAGSTPVTITAGSLVQAVYAPNVEGGTYTLSWSGSATGRVSQGSSPGAYATSPITVSGLAAATQIAVEFTGGTLGTVQLEPGANATPFENRFLSLETSLCQAYYWISSGLSAGFGAGYTTAGTVVVQFPVPMIKAPTPAIANGSVNGGSVLEICVAQHVISGFGSSTLLSTVGGRFDINISSGLKATPQFCIVEAGAFGFAAEL